MLASLDQTPAGLRKHTRFLYWFAAVCLAIGVVGLAITGGSIGWAVCLVLGGKFVGVASILKGRVVHGEREGAGGLTGHVGPEPPIPSLGARQHPWYLSAAAIAFYGDVASASEPAVMMRAQARSQLWIGTALLAAGATALMSTGGCDALALPLIYGGGSLGAAMSLDEFAVALGSRTAPPRPPAVALPPSPAKQGPDCP